MNAEIHIRKQKAEDEFKELISMYMLPLFDVCGNLELVWEQVSNKELI